MAPARTSRRKARNDQTREIININDNDDNDPNVNRTLFIDPMLGSPLAIYIEKDVEDKETISQLITKHGGTVHPGYSGVPYILVDPHKASGQNLWRQYAGKKGKIVLAARWVHECVKANLLHTYHTNWAECKVTGKEAIYFPPPPPPPQQPILSGLPSNSAHVLHPQPISQMPNVDPLLQSQHTFYPPSVFPHPIPSQRVLHPEEPGPPQTWQQSASIAPQQTHVVSATQQAHLMHRQPEPYRDDAWDGYHHTSHADNGLGGGHPSGYDYRYRDDQHGWVTGTQSYYEAAYDHAYDHAGSYMEPSPPPVGAPPTANIAPDPVAGTSNETDSTDRSRGRKRTRTQATPAATASSLVSNRNPPARSPAPPTRIIKSTYGGNLFTADDVLYLKRYIDYCQEQGLVLSLREICERIAVKAPHHTFYSWRRYCNKHQIRLGGYMMNTERSPSPEHDSDRDLELELELAFEAEELSSRRTGGQRGRSPTPPKALFRSTTGKGVAFTEQDVAFLVKFMEHRKSQGKIDMVAFWKEVAAKAPHHSRASWMKFWRRHKHELNRTDGDDPLPNPPEKKRRYSREDDVLLAKYFFQKPEGTSDKVFQAFGRQHSHHPWKGWQEHHRIHKAKIDHLVQMIASGHNIDAIDND